MEVVSSAAISERRYEQPAAVAARRMERPARHMERAYLGPRVQPAARHYPRSTAEEPGSHREEGQAGCRGAAPERRKDSAAAEAAEAAAEAAA